MGAHARRIQPLIVGGGNGGGCCSNARQLCWDILPCLLGVLAALLFAVPLLYYPYQWSFDNGKYPEYSVAVAGFSGLDAAAAAGTPSSTLMDPTFDLTVRIKEPRRWSTECVPRGTTAVVSYRQVRLASGPVPEFCGQNENTTEVGSVMAWGTAVPVPGFARDALADELGRGEAVVDVKLMGPVTSNPYCAYCDLNQNQNQMLSAARYPYPYPYPYYTYCAYCSQNQMVIECKARLGSGEASPPCTVRYDAPALPPNDPARPRGLRQVRKELRTPQESSE